MTEEKAAYKIIRDERMIEAWVDYLMARRESLCRELSTIEKQLESFGRPVKKPKIAKT